MLWSHIFFEKASRDDAKATYAVTMKYFIIYSLILYLGLNLYISRARLKIYDADSSNYVDRFKITGFVAATPSLDPFYDEGTNRITNGIYTYTLPSAEQIGGVFDHFGVRVYTVVGTVGNLDILNVEVEYYYA